MNLVLVIDEDDKNLMRIKNDLGGRRYRVIASSSSRKGLELARAGIPNLLILDMDCSNPDSLEVLKTLYDDEITRGIPVIMLAEKPSKEKILQAKDMGVSRFVLKPYDVEVLLGKITSIMEGADFTEKQSVVNDFQSSALKIVQAQNKLFFSIHTILSAAFLESMRTRVQKSGLFQMEMVVLDIRAIPSLEESEMPLFHTLLGFFGEIRLLVVAGRHYGVLLGHGMEDRHRLFLDAVELQTYFNFLKEVEEPRKKSL